LATGAYGAAPKGAEVCERIELIEEHAAVPKRLGFVVDIRCLPGIDGGAPDGGIGEAIASDGPCGSAGCTVKIGV